MDGPHLRFGELLRIHDEWIAVDPAGRVFALRSHEMDLDLGRGAARLGLLHPDGYRRWTIDRCEIDGRRVTLSLTGRFGAARRSIELIARMEPGEIGDDVREARLASANRISAAVSEAFPAARVRGVFVNQPRGRFARIVLDEPSGKRSGIIADISGGASAEGLLTSAVLWRGNAPGRGKALDATCWIIAPAGKAAQLKRLHSCLEEKSRARIGMLSFGGPEGSRLVPLDPAPFERLWKQKTVPAAKTGGYPTGEVAASLMSGPECVDHLFSRSGMTFRFRGLPFARTRTLHERESAWFGVEKRKRLLRAGNAYDFEQLMDSLAEYRRHDSPNKQHLYYRAAPEAWLESILRRDIAKIDPGLSVSPVYNQFRSSGDRIDLLAISRGGRLVIVEVKLSADPSMVFQAVDYWRRIELQRRSGQLSAAGVFAGREIADLPARVLIVAPAACFGPQTDLLVSCLRSEIELRRVGIAENWREEISVSTLK